MNHFDKIKVFQVNHNDSINVYPLIFEDCDLWIKLPLKSVFIFKIDEIFSNEL